jgi:hypothetical protein
VNFELLKKESKGQSTKIRQTRIKFCVRAEYDQEESFEFWKKNNGKVELKIKCHIPVKSVTYKRCDLGHDHEVERNETWIWNYVTLDKKEVEQLVEFLT